MNTHADKTPGNKKGETAPAAKKSENENAPVVDNRMATIVQKKLQEAIRNSPRVKQQAAYHAMADHYTAPVAQRRYNNPDPAASTSAAAGFAGVTLSEHHVVPYSVLLSFLDKYRAKANAFTALSGFIPADATMDSAKLARLNLITAEAKTALDAAAMTPQAWLIASDPAKDAVIDNIEGAAHLRTRARNSLDRWANTMAATRAGADVHGREPSTDLLLSYATWAKGNLFSGPEGAVREWDPGEGFDTWAQYFIPAARYAILQNINNALAGAIVAVDGDNLAHADVTTVITNLQALALNHNAAVAFDPAAWDHRAGSPRWKPAAIA